MRPFFAAFVAAMMLAALPLLAAEEPKPTPGSAAPCCELPPDHGLDAEARLVYELLGSDYDPTSKTPGGMDRVGVTTVLEELRRKATNKSQRRTIEVMRAMVLKDTHVVYDWFERHVQGTPAKALEKVALFDTFLSDHIPRVFPRAHEPTTVELKRELVLFLNGPYRGKHNFDTADMTREILAPTEGIATGEEVKRLGKRLRPDYLDHAWKVGCALILVTGGVIAYFKAPALMNNKPVAPVEKRLKQVEDRPLLNHPVEAPKAPERPEKDPVFEKGAEAGKDFFAENDFPKAGARGLATSTIPAGGRGTATIGGSSYEVLNGGNAPIDAKSGVEVLRIDGGEVVVTGFR